MKHAIVCACVCVCVVLLAGCGGDDDDLADAPTPASRDASGAIPQTPEAPSRDVLEDARAVAAMSDPWPVGEVGQRLTGVRCDMCHGAGRPPEWAFAADDIVAIRVKRFAGYGYGAPGATATTSLSEAGAEREWELYRDPTWDMPWLPDHDGGRQHAMPDASTWDAARRAVAATGLFRHEGEAVTADCTHITTIAVIVTRRERAECWVVNACGSSDAERHPTFAGLVEDLQRLEDDLAWVDAPH